MTHQEKIKELLTYGSSHQEISLKLRMLGMSVDQSTIHKWKKSKKPGSLMSKSITQALDLLRSSKALFDELAVMEDVQSLLTTVFALKCVEPLKPAAKFDLLPLIRKLEEEGVSTLTLVQLLDVISYLVVTRTVDYGKAVKQIK